MSSEDVTFERSTEGYPKSSIDRSNTARFKLENFYKVNLEQAIERNQRYVIRASLTENYSGARLTLNGLIYRRMELESKLEQEACSDERKNRQLQALGGRNQIIYDYDALAWAWMILLLLK